MHSGVRAGPRGAADLKLLSTAARSTMVSHSTGAVGLRRQSACAAFAAEPETHEVA
jgi:hypothetical protein